MLRCILLASALVLGIDGAGSGGLTGAQEREAAGDDAGALASVEGVVRAWPSEPLPRLEAARLLLKVGGDLERAEAHLEVATAVAPENPRGHYLTGLLWEERGRPWKAAREYELALLYRPSYEEARFRLATLWVSLGDWLKAELHFRILRRASPRWVQVRLQLARVLEAQQRLPEAERELVTLLEEQPANALAVRYLADFYERTGRTKQAEQVRARLKPAEPQRKMRPLRPSRR